MSELKEIKEHLSSKVDRLEKTISDLEEQNRFLREQVKSYNAKVLFFNEYLEGKNLVDKCQKEWLEWLERK